jgi:WD40 repeat protein
MRYRYNMKRLFLISFIIILLSCGQWKTSVLNPTKIYSIASGDNPGSIVLRYEDNGMLELSFHIQIHGGRIYTIDNLLKRIQVLNSDGSVRLIIGTQVGDSQENEFKYSNFNFSSIGSMAIDSEGRIYVQNRFIPKGKTAEIHQDEELDFTPSYILVFDSNGDLQYTLGQVGAPNIPFYYIENMFIDVADRLFVISRTFDSWDLSRFTKRVRDFNVNLGRIDLNEVEGGETYMGKIESISVNKSGSEFLFSVAYYNKTRFKYRKIFEFSIKDNRIVRTILNTPDPKNELYTIVDDKYIYLWNMKNKNIKFVVCNFDGNIINNIMLKFDQKDTLFSDLMIDESGQFYSYHVRKDGINIFEWK